MTIDLPPTRIRPDVQWKEVTEERYNEQRDVLPPACNMSRGYGFCVGEPWDHGLCTVMNIQDTPRWQVFINADGKFYEADKPMTLPEFRRLSAADRAAAVARAVKL